MCAVPMTLSWPTTFPNLLSMHLCNSNDGLSDRCSESCHRDYWDLAIRLPRFHANLLLQDDACTDNKSPIGAKSDGHGSQRDVTTLSVSSLQICESISGIKLHLDKPSSLPPSRSRDTFRLFLCTGSMRHELLQCSIVHQSELLLKEHEYIIYQHI